MQIIAISMSVHGDQVKTDVMSKWYTDFYRGDGLLHLSFSFSLVLHLVVSSLELCYPTLLFITSFIRFISPIDSCIELLSEHAVVSIAGVIGGDADTIC